MHLSLELLLGAQLVWRDSISVKKQKIVHVYISYIYLALIYDLPVGPNYPLDVMFDHSLQLIMQVTVPPHRLLVH